MKYVFIIVFCFSPFISFAQIFTQENEEILLEFTTTNKKRLVIAKGEADKYLAYRFGTEDKIEFEFPLEKENSWKKFYFSWYLRGGGIENAGMDLNYLYFENGGYKYVIYQEYLAETERTDYGIKVINLRTDKTTEIKALPATVRGSLGSLRDSELIQEGDELFK